VKRSSTEKCECPAPKPQFDPVMEAFFGMDPCKKCGWYTCECKAKPKRLKKGTKKKPHTCNAKAVTTGDRVATCEKHVGRRHVGRTTDGQQVSWSMNR